MAESEDKYLRKERPADPVDLRRTGMFLNLLGNLGKYGSLMLGMYGISRENPEWVYVFIGGAGYFTSSFSDFSGNLFGFRSECAILAETEEQINRRLGLLERKASGRVIGAKVLDPNKIPSAGETRLDEMVRKEAVSEIAKEKKEELKKLEEEINGKKDKGDTDKIIRQGWKKT